MLIQHERWWFGRVNSDPFVEGLKQRSKGFGTVSQFDAVRCPIHPNKSSRSRRLALKSFQHIPDNGQLQLLLFGNAVRSRNKRGFVAMFPERRCPLDPGQNTTLGCKSVHLELS